MFPGKLQKSRAARQTYLGLSDYERLTIVDRDKPYPERAFILRLPYEILADIIHIITSDPDYSRYSYSTWKTLSLVCRRLASIVLPLLYRHIELQIPPPNRSLRKLHLALKSNPALWGHCKKLHIHISYTTPPTDEDFVVVEDLVSYLTKVQVLSIHGAYHKFHQGTWSLLQYASQHMHEVHSLELSRETGGLFLRDVVEQIDMPSLKSLSLSGVYRHSTSTGASVLLEPKKYRTATFTSLVLTNYEESPEATQQLINWPESLAHFRFDSFYNNPFYMDLSMFAEWLAIHRDTLESVNIGYLPFGGNTRLFNACDFPKLKVLTLSRWQLAGWPTYSEEKLTFSPLHADLLLGPNLHTFILDFSLYDQHTEAWTHFGDQEENWVTEFAKAAVAKRAALRKIKIAFEPHYREIEEEQGYPWDRMDRIRNEIQPHGLVLEYSKPVLTREEWLQALWEETCAQGDTEPRNALQLDDSELMYQGGDIREYFPRV